MRAPLAPTSRLGRTVAFFAAACSKGRHLFRLVDHYLDTGRDLRVARATVESKGNFLRGVRRLATPTVPKPSNATAANAGVATGGQPEVCKEIGRVPSPRCLVVRLSPVMATWRSPLSNQSHEKKRACCPPLQSANAKNHGGCVIGEYLHPCGAHGADVRRSRNLAPAPVH